MLTAVTNRPYNYRHSVADTATTPQRARFGPSAALDEWNRTSVAIWSRCEDWSSLLYNIWRLLLLNFVFNKLGAILIRRPAGLYTDGTLLAYPRTSRSNAGLFMALSPRKRTTPSRLLGRCFFIEPHVSAVVTWAIFLVDVAGRLSSVSCARFPASLKGSWHISAETVAAVPASLMWWRAMANTHSPATGSWSSVVLLLFRLLHVATPRRARMCTPLIRDGYF